MTVDNFTGIDSAEPLEDIGAYAIEPLDIDVLGLILDQDALI